MYKLALQINTKNYNICTITVNYGDTVVWENSALKYFRHWCDTMKIERMKYF